jgi:hypothetical protein
MEIMKMNSEVTAKAVAMVQLADALVEHSRHFWTSPCVELSFCSLSPLWHRSHYPLDRHHKKPDAYHYQHPSLVSFSPYHHHKDEEPEYACE